MASAAYKGMIGLAVAIATVFVTIEPLTDARPRTTPVSAISERFFFDIPAPTGEAVDLAPARRALAAALAEVAAPKGDRLAQARPARYVTVGRRTGTASSELVRFQPIEVASH
jgi:hypothetical protein